MRDVGLVRWQDYAEMTDDLLDRLAREAIDEARGMAAAEGYFSAKIDVRIDRDVASGGGDARRGRRAGDAHRVRAHRRDRSRGHRRAARNRRDRAAHPRLGAARGRASSGRPRGRSPRSARSPRSRAVRMRRRASCRAKPRSTPTQNRADLVVELASGPAFRFGRLEISGLQKYDAFGGPQLQHDRARRAVQRDRARTGTCEDSTPRATSRACRRRSIPEATHPEDATVDIAVIEARPEAVRRRRRLLDRRAVSRERELPRRELRRQRTSVRGRRPPRDEDPVGIGEVHAPAERRSGWIASYYAGAERTDIESLVTRTAAAGTRWHTIEERDEHALSATYYHDEQQPDGSPTQTANALYAEYERHWRRVDDLIAPTTGWMAERVRRSRRSGHLHAHLRPPARPLRGVAAARRRTTSSIFARKAAPCSPAAATAFRRRCCSAPAAARRCAATISRAWASPRTAPSCRVATMRWRASTRSAGSTSSGASRRSSTRATPSTRWSDAHLALGYGIGARIRTPLGPFRLDVAYGQDVHQVRVQFSVGLTF